MRHFFALKNAVKKSLTFDAPPPNQDSEELTLEETKLIGQSEQVFKIIACD